MNFKFSNTLLGRFRRISIIEGISYLVLLFIAMPIKYIAGIPEVVKYTGWIHGLLFVDYVIVLIRVMYGLKWSLGRGIITFIASLIPFGAFIIDKRLVEEERLLLEEQSVLN
jgi:integral membrane protein